MSFGIVKIIDGALHIHADSFLSGQDVVRHDAQKQSVLKAILLNHQLCLIFAGNVEVAENLVSKICKEFPPRYGQLKNLIIRHHDDNDRVTDYILASCLNRTPKIVEIKNGKVRDNIQSSWVGNELAFDCFQKNYHLQMEDKDPSRAFRSAFEKVLMDVPDIGGLHFYLTQVKGTEIYLGNPMILNYEPLVSMNTTIDDAFMKESGYWDTKYSFASNGGYAFTILSSNSTEFPGVAFHFGHVNLGLLFVPKLFGIYPKEFPNLKGPEFVDEVKKLGVILSGITMDAETNEMFVHKVPIY